MHTPSDDLPTARTDPTTHPDWGRLAYWRDACRTGDCKFVTLNRENSVAGCPGYTGNVYLEAGELVSRYRICDRRAAWERDQTKRRRALEATNTAHGTAVATKPKAKPRGWATDGDA